MDIARPDLKRKRQRLRWTFAVCGALAVAAVSMGLARLEPAAPSVERAQVWTGTVERGEMIRQVRGNGSLVPEKIVTIQSDTGGTVEEVRVWPGAEVKPDTVLMILSNPQLEQEAFDLEWQLKAAAAKMNELEAQLETERFSQIAKVTTLQYELQQAELVAAATETLFREELEAEMNARRDRANAEAIRVSHELEKKRLEIMERSAPSRRSVQEAELEKLRAVLRLKQRQLDDLRVKAGIHGVLQQIGDTARLQLGERVPAASTLARVVAPDQLKAEIKIPETQARDIRIGLRAEVDTRNGVIEGRVSRIDPAVVNGTVAVDVTLLGELPAGARPDLSVDGTIELERLDDVLHLGRPVNGQPEATIGLFKVNADGMALRVPVRLGRGSVSNIEIVSGLQEGDDVILSDMSQWDEFDRIRLR